MLEDTASRFIQHELTQRLILRDPARLLPKRFARWRRRPADNHIANLAFRVAANDVDKLVRSHGLIPES